MLLKYFDPKNELSCTKTKEIQKLFLEELNLKRSASSVKKTLKKLGYRYIKPRRQHEKNNPEAMKAWKEQDLPLFLQEIKLKYPNKKIEVWFQDESRFGQKTRITRQWVPPGQEPRVISQNGFGNCYIYGAVNPHNGSHIGLICSHCDSEVMNLHLKEISRSVSLQTHIVLILDGAGWHRSNNLSIPANMTLFHLPPYSPELNPVERLWLWLKDNFLSNRIMKDLPHMIELGTEAWRQITKDKVESICRVKYLTL